MEKMVNQIQTLLKIYLELQLNQEEEEEKDDYNQILLFLNI